MMNIVETIEPIIIQPEFPKPLSTTKWIIGSSCFFLVPAIYAFLNIYFFELLYLYAFISLCTTVCSINHWRQAEDGIRRKIDKVVAWSAFIVYFVTGFLYFPIYLSTTTASIIISSYMVSDYYSQKHHPYWPVIHMFFHLVGSSTECIIIYYMIEETNN